jgi:predicted phage gp36 major capsid-like protein
MVNPKIVDASEIKRMTRKAPATRMIEALPAGLLTARQVAERFEVNIETIRRLARAKDSDGNDRFTAPSKAAKSGELIIWVYTPEDINELAEYFGERSPKKRGKKE